MIGQLLFNNTDTDIHLAGQADEECPSDCLPRVAAGVKEDVDNSQASRPILFCQPIHVPNCTVQRRVFLPPVRIVNLQTYLVEQYVEDFIYEREC